MSILSSYTLKYLKYNRRRTVVTIIGVILSCALICGVALLAKSYQDLMIRDQIEYSGNYHAEFTNVPYEKAKYILSNSAVKTAMLHREAGCATFGSTEKYTPYVYVEEQDSAYMRNHTIVLDSGRLPQKAGEIVISENMASSLGYKIKPGGTLTVTSGERKGEKGLVLSLHQSSDKETFTKTGTKRYTVVGIAASIPGEYSGDESFVAVEFLDASQLSGTDKVDVQILAKNPRAIYKDAPRIAKSAGITLSDGSDSNAVCLQYNDSLLQWMGISGNQNYNRFFYTVILTIILLIMVGSALVIYNSFSISVSERKKQFGMLSSVGATSAQIRRSVLFEAFIVGIVGIPLGILGGIAGIAATLAVTKKIIDYLTLSSHALHLIATPDVILATAVFAGLTILVSAWIPARRAARVSPVEAIRMTGEIGGKKRKKMKTGFLTRLLFGFEGELALKSFKRDRKKSRTTIISLMISIVLFISFNSLMLYTSISDNMYSSQTQTNYDFCVYFSGSASKYQSFIDKAVALPQVTDYSIVQSIDIFADLSRGQINNNAFSIITKANRLDNIYSDGKYYADTKIVCLDDRAFGSYLKTLGLNPKDYQNKRKPKAILINKNIMQAKKCYEFNLLNVKKGGSLSLSDGDSDSKSSQSVNVTVGAITDQLPLGLSYNCLAATLVVSDSAFQSISSGFKSTDQILSSDVFFKDSNSATFVPQVKALYKAETGRNLSQYIWPEENNKREKMSEFLIGLFFYGFLALVTLIGVTNIVNTIGTNIQLRRREFAMLKSVGLTPRGFKKMLACESIFYGVKSLIFGLPLGILVSFLIYTQFGDITGFGFTLPWSSLLFCIAGVMVIVCSTMAYSAVKIKDDNIVETIKEENF